MSQRLILVFVDIILPLIVGYLLCQRQIISDKLNTALIRFNVVVLVTILSLASFWVLPLSMELLLLPVYGIVFTFLPCVVAMATFARSFPNYLDRGAYVLTATLSNMGTIGGVCAFILHDELGFAYINLMATPQNILLVIMCFPLAQYYLDRHRAVESRTRFRLDLRAMFLTWNQLPFLAMLLGMYFNYMEIERPALVAQLFQPLVHVSAWISLLPVGFLLDFGRARAYYRRIWTLLPLRFVIIPAIMYMLATCFFADQVILTSMLIVALTPSAINAVICTRLYNLNVDIATSAFIMTTPIFLLLIYPILYFYITLGGTL